MTCDRCKATIKGKEYPGGTSGFYRRGKLWGKYMAAGERILCDDCMQSSPEYEAVYGKRFG